MFNNNSPTLINGLFPKENGAVAIELALVTFFIFIPLLLLVSEMGRAMYQYSTLVKSVQDAASYLAKFPANDSTNDQNAINLVLYGGPIGNVSGNKLVSTLSASDISIIRTKVSNLNLIEVSINNFNYSFIVNNFFDSSASFTFGNINATQLQVSN